MAVEETRFYRERGGRQVFGWLLGAVAASVLAALDSPLLEPLRSTALLAGPVAWLIAFRMLCRRRSGIRVHSRGVTEIWALRFPRTIRWEQLSRVRETGRGVTVDGDGCTIRFGPEIDGWHELAAQLKERCPTVELPDQSRTLPREQLEEWLGVPQGGQLRIEPTPPLVGCLVFLLAPLLLARLTWLVNLWPWLGFPLLAAWIAEVAILPAGLALRTREKYGSARLTASGDGLQWRYQGCTVELGWDELHGLSLSPTLDGSEGRAAFWLHRLTGWGWHLHLADGSCFIDGTCTNAQRLIDTIQHVLDAAEEGAVPPPPSTIPDGAISLARLPGEPEVERGISVVRGEGDDGE